MNIKLQSWHQKKLTTDVTFENKGDFNKHIMQDYLQILLDSEIPISFYGEIFKVQEAKYLLKVIMRKLDIQEAAVIQEVPTKNFTIF